MTRAGERTWHNSATSDTKSETQMVKDGWSFSGNMAMNVKGGFAFDIISGVEFRLTAPADPTHPPNLNLSNLPADNNVAPSQDNNVAPSQDGVGESRITEFVRGAPSHQAASSTDQTTPSHGIGGLQPIDSHLHTQAMQAHRQATHVDAVYSPLSTLPVAEIEARLAKERAQRVAEKPRAGTSNNKIPKDGGLRLASRALQAVRTERPQTPRLDKSEITYQ